MQSDIMFDNIYVGHSVEDADKLAQETFHKKQPVEKELELADKPKDSSKSTLEISFMDDPVTYAKEKFDLFITIAKNDLIGAIKFVPQVAAGIGAVLVILIVIVITIFSGSSSASRAGKKAATDGKDKTKEGKDEAKTTGAETGTGAAKRAGKGQS